MTQDITVGFIGYGNMAQAIAQGLVDHGVVAGGRIVACAAHYEKLEQSTAAIGARPLRNAIEVAAAADVVIVAVKPNLVEVVLAPIAGELSNSAKFVVSIASGWTLQRYQALLGGDAHMQCAIPSTPIAVGEGVLITEADNTLTKAQVARFEALFEPISLIERMDAERMDAAVAIAGCGPAFTDMYIEALGDAGVKYGLQRAAAYRLAAKMVEGAGALYMATERHPGVLKDAVCSPGGTTIRGVVALEKAAFRGTVIGAIDAIVEK